MNYIDEDFVKGIKESVKSAITEKNLLDKKEIPEIVKQYKEHTKKQMELERVERTLFKDKYGASIFVVNSPDAITKNGKITNKPKKASNNAWYLWGYNIPLLGDFNKIKYFSDTTEGMLGFSKTALVRGLMSYKYKYSNSQEYAKTMGAFLKDIRTAYSEIKPDREVKGIDDVDKEDYYIEYTFNHWETLQVL